MIDKKKFVYLRYILPSVFIIITVIMFFVPLINFTLEMNEHETMSLAKLIKNAWDISGSYMRNEMETKDSMTEAFVKWTRGGIIVSAFFGAVSLVFSLYYSIYSYKTLRIKEINPEVYDSRKMTMIRILPEKGWLYAVNCLVLIPVIFPYYLCRVYINCFDLDTTVTSSLTWIAVILAVINFVIVYLTRNTERELDFGMFNISK